MAQQLPELRDAVAVAHAFLTPQGQLQHKALFEGVADHFRRTVAAAPEVLQQVPVLTSATADGVPPGALVRLRGMVADAFNPEFFLGAYKSPENPDAWRPAALYTDAPPPDVERAAASTIMERRPLLLSRVPYEQAWASAAWAGQPPEPQTPSAADRVKRTRELGSSTADAPAAAAADAAAAASKQARKSGGADDSSSSELQQPRDQDGGDDGNAAAAAGQAGEDEHAQRTPGYVPGDCIVQVYGDADQFKLHDVIEVLGVVSVVPELAALHMGVPRGGGAAMDVDGGADDEDELWEERVAALPPTSQVLRVHALCCTKVPANPLTPLPAPAPAADLARALSAAPLPPTEQQRASLLRGQVLSLLSTAVGGDDLAAEYLLLTCLGTVVGRDENGAVGLLPLNLSHCPAPPASDGAASTSFVPGVAAALSCLLPHVAHLLLSLPSLNARRWYPQQHAATGRLFRGCLQAPEGTLLLLDETAMAAGQLGEAGVKNLQALHQVLAQQQLPCGCQVYNANLNVDSPALIFSTAGRSLLRDSLNLLQLPLATQQQGGLAARKPGYAEPAAGNTAGAGDDSSLAAAGGPQAVAAAAAALPDLGALRQYLASARAAGIALDQGAAEACVARFRALQAEEQGLGWQDLHVIITLAKLLCASAGQREFSMASWDRAVQLERMRKARVAALQPQAPPPPQHGGATAQQAAQQVA